MTVADLIKELQGYNQDKEIAATTIDMCEAKTTIYPYGVDVAYNREVDKVEIIIEFDSDEEGD